MTNLVTDRKTLKEIKAHWVSESKSQWYTMDADSICMFDSIIDEVSDLQM